MYLLHVRSSADSGAFVLGPSRSGTSVLTNVLHQLGLALPQPGDLYTGLDNPDGHWESRTVIALNDRLLNVRDASWGLPPRVGAFRLEADDVREFGPDFATAFGRAFPHGPWVCKDPRLSFTAPFWRAALGVRPINVLAVRHPSEVAASLARDGVPTAHALAMWERYMLAALDSVLAEPVILVSFEDLLRNPDDTVRELSDHLTALGVDVHPTSVAGARHAVKPGNRRHRVTENAVEELTGVQRSLWELLHEIPRQHDAMPPVGVVESAYTTELLGTLAREQWFIDRRAMLKSPRRWFRHLLGMHRHRPRIVGNDAST